jgi:hypothetical protein
MVETITAIMCKELVFERPEALARGACHPERPRVNRHSCNNSARFVVFLDRSTPIHVCGVHVGWYKKHGFPVESLGK